jgi:hypothetical protein
MSAQELPANPSLKSLKNQAKTLLHAQHSGQNDACERIKASHPRLQNLSTDAIKKTEFALVDAQLVIAREYGFDSWPKMTETIFEREQHFANEKGWEWIHSPNLDHPLGSSGCMGGECLIMYNNRDQEDALSVYLAMEKDFEDRDCRPIALDEEGKRYEIKQGGSCSNEAIALKRYQLPYSEVENRIRYLGIEARKA